MNISEQPQSKILEGLNPAQHAAVVNFSSPSLIIAGAGSGKTRVLTSRIAYMLEQGVRPHNILALTFTNKAAEQMRSRIEQMVGPQSRFIRMGTFHSVFSRILRENAERIGYPQSYTIYEPSDSKNLIKTICKEMSLSDDKYKPQRLLSRISFAKNALVTPAAYKANTMLATEDRQAQIPQFAEVYDTYCRRCKQNGAMDFDDLLLQTNILLRDCPDVLARYQELFQYILVDEYQDTNYAQYIIIRRLSQLHGRVCVVGDDAQSIYSFRGAKIENSGIGSAVVVIVQPLRKGLHAAFQIVAIFDFLLGECEGAEVGKIIAECKLENLALCPAYVLRELLLIPCFSLAGKLSASVCKLITGFAYPGAYCQLRNMLIVAVQEALVVVEQVMLCNSEFGHRKNSFPGGMSKI